MPRPARTRVSAGASGKGKAASTQTSSNGAPEPLDHASPPTASTTNSRLPFHIAAFLKALSPILSSPSSFLTPSPALGSTLLSLAKASYDRTVRLSSSASLLPTSAALSSLPSLLVDGFTVEQVWEQLQLLHRPLLLKLNRELQKLEKSVNDEGKSAAFDEHKQAAQDVDEEHDDADEHDKEDEELDDDDAEMEARLDAVEAEDDAEVIDDDGEDASEASEEDEDGEAAAAASPSRKRPREERKARDVVADAFFSLEQMERFADHFERLDSNPEAAAAAGQRKRKQNAKQLTKDANDDEDEDEDDEEDDEYGGAVDLDADVGEIDMSKGETYDDFFDSPTAEELKGQSLATMQDDEGEDEEDEQDEGEEDDTAAPARSASLEDEFGGYFARLAAQQRKLHAAPPAPAASASSSTPSAPLSSYARQQQALAPTLASIEHSLVNPKPWYHRGEVTALQRPADSLLEQDVEVDWAGKEREVMTREVNEAIEDMIRRRVSEAQYDDVERKQKPKPQRTVRDDDVDVSAEKSSKSLAQLYEDDYLEQKQREDAAAAGTAVAPRRNKKQQQRDAAVSEVRTLLAGLMSSMSSLSNYHFVPPVATEEVRIVRGEDEQQLLMREEVGIDFESAEGARPGTSRKEVGGSKTQSQMVGEAERQSEERKRRRRRNKEVGRKRRRAEALQGDKGDGGGKAMSERELRQVKTARNVKEGVLAGGVSGAAVRHGKSAAFFRELQANVAASEADARNERSER